MLLPKKEPTLREFLFEILFLFFLLIITFVIIDISLYLFNKVILKN